MFQSLLYSFDHSQFRTTALTSQLIILTPNIMYQPRLFKEERVETLHQLIHHNSFATLVTNIDNGISIDHIPMLILPDQSGASAGVLQGHLARPNPLVKKIGEGLETVVVFQGPDSYITPSWYPSKKVHGKVVPTWNYAVVHVRGVLTLKDDSEWLRDLVSRLTDHQESERPTPWKVTDAPADFVTEQLQAIVGIELVISSIEGKWKVSQNKTEEDSAGVVSGIEAERSFDPMAKLVEAYAKKD